MNRVNLAIVAISLCQWRKCHELLADQRLPIQGAVKTAHPTSDDVAQVESADSKYWFSVRGDLRIEIKSAVLRIWGFPVKDPDQLPDCLII